MRRLKGQRPWCCRTPRGKCSSSQPRVTPEVATEEILRGSEGSSGLGTQRRLLSSPSSNNAGPPSSMPSFGRSSSVTAKKPVANVVKWNSIELLVFGLPIWTKRCSMVFWLVTHFYGYCMVVIYKNFWCWRNTCRYPFLSIIAGIAWISLDRYRGPRKLLVSKFQ